jgi:hypothetical protein
VPNLIDALISGSMFVLPFDRSDILLAAAMGTLKNVPIAA